MQGKAMLIERRHNGPADSAHGGVAAGRFAEAAGTPLGAAVRLLRPPPLEVELSPRPTDGGIEIIDVDDEPVALVRGLATRDVDPFPRLSASGLAAARAAWATRLQDMADPSFNTCFGCGTAEARPDGLGLHAGLDPTSGYCATSWVPEPGAGGDVAPWMVWAALDCPAISAAYRDLPPGTIAVTGELSVRIGELPRAGEPHQVVARWTAAAGRRVWSEVGLVDDGGRNLAVGWATTVVIGHVDDEAR